MNRRGFLGTLAAALVGSTLDPERLLWVPGVKTLFVPPVSGWAPTHNGTTLLTINQITHEALLLLRRNIVIGGVIDPQYLSGRPALVNPRVTGITLARPRRDESVGDYSSRVLEPAVALVAAQIPRGDVCGQLDVPRGLMQVARADYGATSLRACSVWDVRSACEEFRIDVLHGSEKTGGSAG